VKYSPAGPKIPQRGVYNKSNIEELFLGAGAHEPVGEARREVADLDAFVSFGRLLHPGQQSSRRAVLATVSGR